MVQYRLIHPLRSKTHKGPHRQIQNTSSSVKEATEFEAHQHAETRSRENLPVFSLWCCLALGWVAGRSGVPVFNKSQVQISPHCAKIDGAGKIQDATSQGERIHLIALRIELTFYQAWRIPIFTWLPERLSA